MNTKLFLISLAFLFSNFSFAGKIHNLVKKGDLIAIQKLAESEEYKNDKKKLAELINSEDNTGSGYTSLHLAVEEGHKGIVEFLIENGADVNARSTNYDISLHLAVEEGHKEIVELLIQKESDINAQDFWGMTPLHLAVWREHPEIVELLIQKEAHINATDKDDETPLHLAAHKRYEEIAELLIQKGAKINVQNKWDETPLDVAYLRGGIIVLVLEKAGAKRASEL